MEINPHRCQLIENRIDENEYCTKVYDSSSV